MTLEDYILCCFPTPALWTRSLCSECSKNLLVLILLLYVVIVYFPMCDGKYKNNYGYKNMFSYLYSFYFLASMDHDSVRVNATKGLIFVNLLYIGQTRKFYFNPPSYLAMVEAKLTRVCLHHCLRKCQLLRISH